MKKFPNKYFFILTDFKRDDVGKAKVDAAIENAKFHNINNTEIIGFNINALTNWQKIIELVKSSTIIFNMIDVGSFHIYNLNYLF